MSVIILKSVELCQSKTLYFNRQFFLLDQTGKVLITERFGIKIAEGSRKALKLWKRSSLDIAKVGAIPTTREISSFQNFLRGPKPV